MKNMGDKENFPETVQNHEITAYFQEFGNSIKQLSKDQVYNNVAIFIDYDNVYWTLMNLYNHDPNNSEENKNLFKRLWNVYGQDNVRTFRVYADFQRIRTSLTSLQKQRVQIRHVYSNDKDGDQRKNSSDIELCIDAIESTYKDNNISCYVFVTADSDMVPVMSRLMFKGKRVELYYLSAAAPKHTDITNYTHYSQDLLEFLNIEIQEFNVENYVIDALNYIDQWENKFGDDNKFFLGQPWLKEQFKKEFSIPSETASNLLEKLQLDKLVENKNKELKGGQLKPSLALTSEGKSLIGKVMVNTY